MNQLEMIYTQPFNGLTEEDMKDFSRARRAIYSLMKDGAWHGADNIIAVSGIREGLRRMRELREWYTVEKRNAGNRNFEYKLTNRLG